MIIRMLETVLPDLLFLAKPGTILQAGNEYEARANKNGAISGLCPNGEYLGVRPGEFVFMSVPAWVQVIWAEVNPQALDWARIENVMEDDKIRLRNSLGECSSCEEVEGIQMSN